MKTWWMLTLAAVLFIGLSCGRKSEPAPGADEMTEEVAPPPPLSAGKASRSSAAKTAAAARSSRAAKMAAAGKDVAAVLGSAGVAGSIVEADLVPVQETIRARMVIKTAELGFEVEHYDETTAQLQKLVAGWGGFVTTSTTEIPYENVKTGTWVLRVPSDKFDPALDAIKKLAKKLEKESIGGQDVTEEFYDLEARLENKLLEEKQVRDILRRAGTIKDVLDVQRELSRIREEIERFEGRKKFLIDQAGLSTIAVNLHEAYPVAVSSRGGFWATIGSGFSEGFRGFANVLAGTITFLIAGLPVFALIGGVVWIIVHFVRRAVRKRKEAKASPPSA